MPKPSHALFFAIGILLLDAAHPDGPAQNKQLAAAGADGETARHQAIRERTATRFAGATFSAPESNSAGGDRIWMAPLVIQECVPNSNGGGPVARFGALNVEEAHRVTVNTRQPTIYTTSSKVQIGDRPFEQQTFLWFYPPTSQGASPRWRGFRQTLDKHNFAFVREIISSDDQPTRVFFVSKALERAAAKQFGKPLPGRRFSVESDGGKHPQSMVARLVPKGPQPMGPYVHLDDRSLAIVTIRCRCEPSLVDHFLGSYRFRLVPLKHLADLFTDAAPPPEMCLPADSAELDGLLRWPANF